MKAQYYLSISYKVTFFIANKYILLTAPKSIANASLKNETNFIPNLNINANVPVNFEKYVMNENTHRCNKEINLEFIKVPRIIR